MFGLSPLTPAYGRDYKSKKALEADFNADMDFYTPSGSSTNKSDLLTSGHTQIQVRYKNLRSTAVIKIAGPIVPITDNQDPVHKKFTGISIGRYQKLDAGLSCVGFCLTCSKKVINVEDDAEDYECPRCKNHTVQGLGNILMMGLVN